MTAYHRQKEIQRFYAEDHPYVLRISELEQRISDLERQLAEAIKANRELNHAMYGDQFLACMPPEPKKEDV